MPDRIPFNRPFLVGTEFEAMREAAARFHISDGGPFTEQCESLLQHITGARAVLLTSSCTHALEIAALLLDVGPGDEVILPSFTFVSTANAFALRGATPVFADMSGDTLNIDPESVASRMTDRTRAVVAMHYAGVACDMERLRAVTAQASVSLVEDNAHGLFGTYLGKPLGSHGVVAALSFHETKNLTCGRGGALLLNDDSFQRRARIIRTNGTNRDEFFEGLVDKYSWVDLGSAYLPSDLLSAFLLCQLNARAATQARRHDIWHRYHRELSPWAGSECVRLPIVPAYAEHPSHLFYLVMPSAADRRNLIRHLERENIHAVFHYVPLHSSAMGRALGADPLACPVAEDVSQRLLRLPFFTGMSADEQTRVIDAVCTYSCGSSGGPA
jgi:dTDP-4-amino-4,6-dideoxygalactose transaminase